MINPREDNNVGQKSGSILRIATKELVDVVFEMAIYYTNMNRKWNSGHMILFVNKTELGDAFVGYGSIERISEKDILSEEEQAECFRGGWKRAIEFKYVKRFAKPLLIKDTFFKDSKLRGRYFHGLTLNEQQVNELIQQGDVRKIHQKS
jgi:hypothetical protein